MATQGPYFYKPLLDFRLNVVYSNQICIHFYFGWDGKEKREVKSGVLKTQWDDNCVFCVFNLF